MTFTLIYIASIIYCLYMLSKSENRHTISDIPDLDTLIVLVLAPFLAAMDLLISIINFIKRKLWI
jgi:hypothetical protein